MSTSSYKGLLETRRCHLDLPVHPRRSNVTSVRFPKDLPGDDQEDGIVEQSGVIRDLTGVDEDSNERLVEVVVVA